MGCCVLLYVGLGVDDDGDDDGVGVVGVVGLLVDGALDELFEVLLVVDGFVGGGFEGFFDEGGDGFEGVLVVGEVVREEVGFFGEFVGVGVDDSHDGDDVFGGEGVVVFE